MDTFLLTLKVVSLLLVYLAIGFFLGKKKIAGENAGKTLAVLINFVIMPIYNMANLSKNVTVDKISLYIELFLAGSVLMVVSLAVCIPLSRIFFKKGFLRNIYKYLLFTSNIGYFGYPLVESVFGEEMLSMYMIFVLPFSFAIYTYGYLILTDKSEEFETYPDESAIKARRKDMLKRLFSLPIIGTFVGIALGLLPFEMPEIFYEFLSPAAECMRAIVMILMGLVLSEMSFKTLFTSKKAYLLCLMRLVIYPTVFGGIAYALYLSGMSSEIFIFTVCLMALPAGLNVVVCPEAVGLSGKEGAQACFISYLFALVTLPLIFLAVAALV